jgi:hypothetical protein
MTRELYSGPGQVGLHARLPRRWDSVRDDSKTAETVRCSRSWAGTIRLGVNDG